MMRCGTSADLNLIRDDFDRPGPSGLQPTRIRGVSEWHGGHWLPARLINFSPPLTNTFTNTIVLCPTCH